MVGAHRLPARRTQDTGRVMTALLQATDLHKSFGATPALLGATLRVEPGEIIAVMGPSGSGKSTLLHCASGILPLDGGTVSYRGNDLSAMSDRQRSALRRYDFGFIFQFGQLVPELTCRENLALPLRLAGAARRTCSRSSPIFPSRPRCSPAAARSAR